MENTGQLGQKSIVSTGIMTPATKIGRFSALTVMVSAQESAPENEKIVKVACTTHQVRVECSQKSIGNVTFVEL